MIQGDAVVGVGIEVGPSVEVQVLDIEETKVGIMIETTAIEETEVTVEAEVEVDLAATVVDEIEEIEGIETAIGIAVVGDVAAVGDQDDHPVTAEAGVEV